ncbi:MAG: hypothetical protein QOH61_1791 [Chloroflexota bacterium]|jgi:hypothetical protein|nr:hypothetical protein [Chloroflexota bacterium]
MIDYRWLRPSEAELFLPDRHKKPTPPRWPGHGDSKHEPSRAQRRRRA